MACCGWMALTQAGLADQAGPAQLAASAKKVAQGTILVLTPKGFARNQLHFGKGKTLLVIENRSGIRVLRLTIDRLGADGASTEKRVSDDGADKQVSYWHPVLDLEPGKYRISEQSRHWVCDLIVQ